jgi:hypothetical protein
LGRGLLEASWWGRFTPFRSRGGVFGQPSARALAGRCCWVLGRCRRRCLAVSGERVEAFERAEDRGDPGPVGGEVQGALAGVAGEVPGDVQDSVAQPLGLACFVFPVEGELLGPDRHIVRGQRKLQPRGVGREGVKREMRATGRFERLDAILDLGVLAVDLFQHGEILAVLVSDKALKTGARPRR